MLQSIAEMSAPGGNSARLQRSEIQIIAQGHSPKRIGGDKQGANKNLTGYLGHRECLDDVGMSAKTYPCLSLGAKILTHDGVGLPLGCL
jgi:hypothetical protein